MKQALYFFIFSTKCKICDAFTCEKKMVHHFLILYMNYYTKIKVHYISVWECNDFGTLRTKTDPLSFFDNIDKKKENNKRKRI